MMQEKQPRKGIFWIIVTGEGEHLLACPFREGSTFGLAKSGDTYSHRQLWDFVCPEKCDQSWNYYPRGRVEINKRGQSILYMSPFVSTKFLPEIKEVFGLIDEPRVRYDFSSHYECFLN